MDINSAGSLMSFVYDMESPHRLGERSDEETEVMKWLKSGDGVYSSCQDSEIVDKMEAGMYTVFQDGRGATHAQKFDPETDELYYLPNNHIKEISAEIATFWEKSAKFEQYKLKHKRGIMLMGGPGTGKTSIINLLSVALIDNGGLVFSVSNSTELSIFTEFAQSHLREVEPDRPVILIIEDIDKYMDGSSTESALLNFLDGEDSISHIVVVATTNRSEALNDLLLRPSRFDHQIVVDKPDEVTRLAYLINKGLDEADAKLWSKDTKNYSLAELKELFISVVLLDLDYHKSKQKINDNAESVTEATFVKPKGKVKSVGFGVGKKD